MALNQGHTRQRSGMIGGLDTVSIFSELDFSALEEISTFCERLSLMEGDVLISENDASSNDLFILFEGKVEIISNGTGVTSGEISISKHDKEIFGEISWMSGAKRTATIRCVGDVDAVRIDGKKLTHYLETHPDSGYFIMRRIALLLAHRLDQTNNLLKQVLWNSNI